MNEDESDRDVENEEKILKKKKEMGDDINENEDELREVNYMGGKMMKRNKMIKDVEERMEIMKEEYKDVRSGWVEKGEWMRK